jgi:urease subunit beta
MTPAPDPPFPPPSAAAGEVGRPLPRYRLRDDAVEINAGRRTTSVTVENTGDRPIQVGSHYHFFEVNRALRFDRDAAFGMRLNIPAGTAVRFEPGDTRQVDLVAYGGTQRVVGFSGAVNGSVSVPRPPPPAPPAPPAPATGEEQET